MYKYSDQQASIVPRQCGRKKWPGINCLRMCNHCQKNLGIHVRLKMSVKYASNIFPYHGEIDTFGMSVHYEVQSFACLTMKKASWVHSRVDTVLSW